jgi:hypothetical protein
MLKICLKVVSDEPNKKVEFDKLNADAVPIAKLHFKKSLREIDLKPICFARFMFSILLVFKRRKNKKDYKTEILKMPLYL